MSSRNEIKLQLLVAKMLEFVVEMEGIWIGTAAEANAEFKSKSDKRRKNIFHFYLQFAISMAVAPALSLYNTATGGRSSRSWCLSLFSPIFLFHFILLRLLLTLSLRTNNAAAKIAFFFQCDGAFALAIFAAEQQRLMLLLLETLEIDGQLI